MSYQDLSGGIGRKVFFRPRRFRAKAIFGEAEPVVRIGDAEARLVDLSTSGMACDIRTDEAELREGSVLSLQLWVSDERAFSAQAVVVRSEDARRRVALRFLDAVPELPHLRDVARDQAVRAAVRAGVGIFDPIPAEYRSAVQEVVTVLAYWRRFLNQREAELAAFKDTDGSLRTQQLEESAEKALRADWWRAHSRANEAAEALFAAPEVLRAAKSLTELLVTPLLLEAPIWRRAYDKPRGYPGDFELMNFMYDETRSGESVYARIMHQLGREERLAATVRNRRDLLVRRIREGMARAISAEACEFKICNVGAGPARELVDLLSSAQLPLPLKVWLVDQDEDALAHAYDRLRAAAGPLRNKLEVRCRFTSFRQLLASPELLSELKGQDLIYSAGLFDYLSVNVAQALLQRLSLLLRGGGTMLVGNAASAPGVRWVPELVLDWTLRYRTTEEMLELAADLPVPAQIHVQRDDSDAWHFLVVKNAAEDTDGE